MFIQEDVIKKTLKETLLQAVNSAKYASIDGLRKKLQLTRKGIPSTSLYGTLYRLVDSGRIFDAGRGWYSTIDPPFVPHYDSINGIVDQLGNRYPRLQFSVWSTEQLQAFAHHLMTRYTVFLFTETDAISSVTEFLQNQKHTAYPNPKQTEVVKYVASANRRIIVRPVVTKEPVEGHFATIEKILVDLFLEKDRLFLMDGAEYRRIFENIIFANRIVMGRLFGYAERRKINASLVKLCSEYRSLIIM